MVSGRPFLELAEGYKRLYAIGDLHGCLRELDSLINYLEQKEALSDADTLIFMGDYVDRGSKTRELVDFLIALQSRYPLSIFLHGNHEEMMLRFIGEQGPLGWSWLENGGGQCLESYGAHPGMIIDQARTLFPPEHLAFFNNLERYVISDKYVFVHAGLDPLRDLRQQVDDDLFWIRSEFVTNIHHFEKTVVFGHTPYHDVMFHLPYKIGVDTALVYGNCLSCIELTNQQVFQVASGKRKVTTATFAQKASLPIRPYHGKRRGIFGF